MDVNYLMGHVLDKFLRKRIGENERRELLEVMIYEGKIQYIKSQLWPHDPPHNMMGYTLEQACSKVYPIILWGGSCGHN